jgi:hypothetical protein
LIWRDVVFFNLMRRWMHLRGVVNADPTLANTLRLIACITAAGTALDVTCNW